MARQAHVSHPERMDSAYGGARERTPWQVWVAVAFLAFEAVFVDLATIPENSQAAIWFLAKCVFVTGLLLHWRVVYVLTVIVSIVHVVEFMSVAPAMAFLNLVLVLLLASVYRFYFPE